MPIPNPFRWGQLVRQNLVYYIQNGLQFGWDILKLALGVARNFPSSTPSQRSEAFNVAQQAFQLGRTMFSDHNFFPTTDMIPINRQLPKGYRYVMSFKCVNVRTKQVSVTFLIQDDDRAMTFAELDDRFSHLVANRAVGGSPPLPGRPSDRQSCALLSVDSIERNS